MPSRYLMLAVAAVVAAGLSPTAQKLEPDQPPWQAFIAAAGADHRQAEAALADIAVRWRDGYAAMIVDVARFLPSPRVTRAAEDQRSPSLDDPVDEERSRATAGRGDFSPLARERPGADTRRRLTSFLERQTRKRFGDDLRAWRRWMWALPVRPASRLRRLQGRALCPHRPAVPGVLSPAREDKSVSTDQLGGVPVNGIPPLRPPKTRPAIEATWLRDGHLVFGIVINGEARAYPKRILAWHEMATDRLGGIDLTVVSAPLRHGDCLMSRTAGRRFTFGTSGLLYRSTS